MIGYGALFAGAAQQCQGGEVSEDGLGNRGDKCCNVSTWSSQTYRHVKGTTAWRYWRERLITEALENALAPSTMGLPTKIHQIAYDAGLNENAAVPADLPNRIGTALNNFRILFPLSRWHKVDNCVKGKYDDGVCTGGEKKLSCFRSNAPPHTPEVASLLSSIIGTPVTIANLDAVYEWDWVPSPVVTSSTSPFPDLPFGPGSSDEQLRKKWEEMPAFMMWAETMHHLIVTSPGAGRGDLASNTAAIPPDKLFTRVGDLIQPVPWLASFVKAMSPSKIMLNLAPTILRKVAPAATTTTPLTLTKAVTQLAPKVRPSITTEEGGAAPPAETVKAEPEGIDPKMLAIGGVALVAVGFGAYILLRK